MKKSPSITGSIGRSRDPRDPGSDPLRVDTSLKRKMATNTLLTVAISVLILCVAFAVYEMICFPDVNPVRVFAVVAAAGLVSFLIAAFLARQFHEDEFLRLLQLAESARIVCDERNYTLRIGQRPHPLRRDEIDFLAERIDEMISRLQNQAAEVERVYRELDRSVLEKTESMRQSRDAALEESRLKTEILSNVSHEIRTPMTGVMGMIELVLDSDLDEKQKELLGIAKTSSEAIIAIAGDLLDFEAIESDRMQFETVDFNLKDLLAKIGRSIDFQPQPKQPSLVCKVEEEVPVLLRGDPVRLRQIITNLLKTTIRFNTTGEVVLAVGVESRTATEVGLHFTVARNGTGFSRDKENQNFEVFTRIVGSARHRHEGFGLGLAISFRLVERMGGKIWVASDESERRALHFTVFFGLPDLSAESLETRKPSEVDRSLPGSHPGQGGETLS